MSQVHGIPQPIVSWRNRLPEKAEFLDHSELTKTPNGYVQKVRIKREMASGAVEHQTWIFTFSGGQIASATRAD